MQINCTFCGPKPAGVNGNWTKFRGRDVCATCVYGLQHSLEETRDELDAKKDGRPKVPIFMLLELPPQKSSIFLVVDAFDYSHNRDKGIGTTEFEENQRYYYEEHTCPTNFIGAQLISIEGDQDRHGLFNYIRSVKATGVPTSDSWDFWKNIFPEIERDYEVTI